MSLKKAYYYFFYKIYSFSERMPARWLSDWKAALVMDVLWLFVLFALGLYYEVIFGRKFLFGNDALFIVVFLFAITLPNYLIFHHRNQWKKIVQEFSYLPPRKNMVGGIVVSIVIVAVVLNLMFSFYLLGQHYKYLGQKMIHLFLGVSKGILKYWSVTSVAQSEILRS